LQENVHWTNGLHQFLEIKHGLPVTTEGMTSNFISNLGHFDKYKELYGLTGTLGSEKSKEFLKKTYQTELFKVPPFKERRLTI
jgi:preprotein translocase subunit SecA